MDAAFRTGGDYNMATSTLSGSLNLVEKSLRFEIRQGMVRFTFLEQSL